MLKSSVSINLYPKRRHYCIKKKLLVENFCAACTNFLGLTLLCFPPGQVLNKHGFFFVRCLSTYPRVPNKPPPRLIFFKKFSSEEPFDLSGHLVIEQVGKR